MDARLESLDAAAIERAYRSRSEDDLGLFARGLYIPWRSSEARLFGTCITGFQDEFFGLLGPSLTALRLGRVPPWRRFWVERTKKAAKDSDVAICLLWLMRKPMRPLFCPVSAANQDQAGIIKRRASDLLYLNPWLNDYVKIRQNKIVSSDGLGEVRIEATGRGEAKHGDTPDLLVLNELVHVDRWEVNKTHMNNANGCPHGIVIVCTNAGIRGTPAETWRKNAISKPERWKVLLWKDKAPWVSDEDIEEARQQDPVQSEFRRLWKGEWVSGRGAAVDDETIERCFSMKRRWKGAKQGWKCVAGLDLGVSHDHAGLCVLAANPRKQRIVTAWFKGWAPSMPNDKGQLEVDADEVELACRWAYKTFKIQTFWYDPAAGGSFMAQKFRRLGIPMREMSFGSPKNLDDMARSFVQVMKAGKLRCYDDPDGRLRRDFGKFSIVVKLPSGYRLEAVSDEYGHADVGTALVIALPQAVEMLGGWGRLQGDDDLVDGDEGELSKDEVDAMPTELRDICDAYDDMDERAAADRC